MPRRRCSVCAPACYSACVQRDYDAIVIGGGPAGSMAALLLARQGWRVALLERGPRHRDKTCGHCLNPRIVPLLKQLGVWAQVQAVSMGRTSALRVYVQGQQALTVQTHAGDEAAQGWLTPRRALDQVLLDVAAAEGVTVVQPAHARVERRAQMNAAVSISHGTRDEVATLQTKLVIGADGLRSTVAASMGLGPGRSRSASRRGGKYGFSFAHLPIRTDTVDPDIIHMFVGRHGYLGVAVERGMLHVAGLVQSAGSMSVRRRSNELDELAARDPFAFCRQMAGAHPVLEALGLACVERTDVQRFVAAGPMPWRPVAVAGPCAALVGDAAGYVEPFTGEGMSWAIESAAALGEVTALLKPGEWSKSASKKYRSLWRTRVGARQRECGWIAAVLERPRLAALAARVARLRPALARRVVDRVVVCT